MSNHKIVHVDMDAFFVSVELKKRPDLVNSPVAVGGTSGRGVVSTCNYIAREFGVRSAMSSVVAKARCPNLVFLPTDMPSYREYSRIIREVFLEYTTKVEPLSLDEAFLDLTDCTLLGGSATLIAEEIRAKIYARTGLTASAGVSNCKFIAKIASDWNKPNGTFIVPPDSIPEFVRVLDLKKIPGVGKATLERLHSHNLYTCEDVQGMTEEYLVGHFGKFGGALWERSHGRDDREVNNNRERKSVGAEETFAEDIDSQENCIEELALLKEKVLLRFEAYSDNKDIHKLKVKVKFDDFETVSCESVASSISDELILSLLEKALARSNRRKIRLLGLSIGIRNKEKYNQTAFDF